MMGQVLKDRRLLFGALPVNLLDRSNLSPLARLLWVVLDSCGVQQLTPSLSFLAVRMGMHPVSGKKTVLKYLRELSDGGFVDVQPGAGPDGSNRYTLTMPDYCWLDSPKLLQLAVKEPVKAGSEGWTAGKGKDGAPPQKKASIDRVAWNLKRQQRLQQQRATGQALLGLFAAPADAPAAQAVPNGNPPPVPAGNPPGPERELQAVPSGNPKKETELRTRNKRESSAGATPPPASLSQSETPAGWADFAQAWQQLHRRPWRWTRKAQQLALQVNDAVGDVQLVPGTWRSYLANAYWQAKAHPLQGLVAQVHEHVPAAPAPAARPRCAHGTRARTSTRTERAGVAGTLETETCSSCGAVVGQDFHRDPTPEELERQQAFVEQLKRKGIHVSA